MEKLTSLNNQGLAHAQIASVSHHPQYIITLKTVTLKTVLTRAGDEPVDIKRQV